MNGVDRRGEKKKPSVGDQVRGSSPLKQIIGPRHLGLRMYVALDIFLFPVPPCSLQCFGK